MRASLVANQANAFSSTKKGKATGEIAQDDISRHKATNGDARGRLRGAEDRNKVAKRQKRRSLPGANSQLTLSETDRPSIMSSARLDLLFVVRVIRRCDWLTEPRSLPLGMGNKYTDAQVQLITGALCPWMPAEG